MAEISISFSGMLTWLVMCNIAGSVFLIDIDGDNFIVLLDFKTVASVGMNESGNYSINITCFRIKYPQHRAYLPVTVLEEPT